MLGPSDIFWNEDDEADLFFDWREGPISGLGEAMAGGELENGVSSVLMFVKEAVDRLGFFEGRDLMEAEEMLDAGSCSEASRAAMNSGSKWNDRFRLLDV